MLDQVVNWLFGSSKTDAPPKEENGFVLPPEVQQPRKEESKLRWGFLEIGNSTWEMANALKLYPQNSLVSVFSSSPEKRGNFSRNFNIRKAYDKKNEFLNIYEIDVIYISCLITERIENCILGLEKGKHIVIESPIGIDEHGIHTIISLAIKKKLLIVEALPFMFSPLRFKLQNLIHEGDIGKIQLITINYGIADKDNSQQSALMTLGIHALSLTILSFSGQEPSHVGAVGDIFQNLSFDKQVSMSLLFKNNQMAGITCSRIIDIEDECIMHCTNGVLKIHNPFSNPKMIVFTPSNDNSVQLPSICIPLTSPTYEIKSSFPKSRLDFDSPTLICSPPVFNDRAKSKSKSDDWSPNSDVLLPKFGRSLSLNEQSRNFRESIVIETSAGLVADGREEANSKANDAMRFVSVGKDKRVDFRLTPSSASSEAASSASLNGWMQNSVSNPSRSFLSSDLSVDEKRKVDLNSVNEGSIEKEERKKGKENENLSPPMLVDNGYGAMVKEICRCIENDTLECASMRIDDSIRLVRTLHRVRNHIGLTHQKDIDRMKVASLSDWGTHMNIS